MLGTHNILIEWDHHYRQGLTDRSLLEKRKDSSKAQNITKKTQLEVSLHMSIQTIWYKYNADTQ
jgi:hypothetical protein